MPKKSAKDLARERALRAQEDERDARGRSRQALGRFQFYIGVLLVFSALLGIYLLATDQSLWILAASHAYGLAAIVGIDLVLGALSILLVRRIFLISIAGALLGLLLQIGDVVTASQYGMTIEYFASYLFGLWAFDALIATQLLAIVIGIFSRVHVRTLTGSRRFRQEFDASRRQFLKVMLAFGVVVGFSSLLSLLGRSQQIPTTMPPPGLPSGAVANANELQPGTPTYFDFPTGYPNILLKRGDGSLVGLSLLCTHVCCELSYDPTVNQLYCPCHGSVFDDSGNVLQGPAVYPLPTIELSTDGSGNVFPKKTNGSSPCIQT